MHTLPKITPEAVAFFLENAGMSYDPARETREQGAARHARGLARAEAWLKADNDLRIDWAPDDDHFSAESPSDHVETCEQAVLTNGNVDVLASLGCIDDATPEYRRVIEAELAWEAMPAELRCDCEDVDLDHTLATCGDCGSTWCDACAPSPAGRCHWEAEHDDESDDDVTPAERVDYALTRLRRWADNFETNATSAREQGRHTQALELDTRARDCRDVIKMLDGSDDDYIRSLRKA